MFFLSPNSYIYPTRGLTMWMGTLLAAQPLHAPTRVALIIETACPLVFTLGL